MKDSAAASPADVPEADTGPGKRPFAAWLQEHDRGALHAELTDELLELVAAVREHDKAGTVTLTVKVGPVDSDDSALMVEADVKSKRPTAPRPNLLFFADAKGNISRRDPRQPELPLRDASTD